MIYHLEAYHGAQEAELKHLHSQVCDEVRCWKDSAGKPEESIYQPSRAWPPDGSLQEEETPE